MRSTHSQTALTAWLVTAAVAATATYTPWQWSLDISRVYQGEWWRIITGHFVHLSWQHYLYDLLGLGLALALCITTGLRNSAIVQTAFVAIGTVSAVLLFAHPVDIYGGLSGITAGLLSLGTLRMINKGALFSGAVLTLCLLFKLIQEYRGIAVSGIAPVWQAHAAGAATGIIIATFSREQPTMIVSCGYDSTTCTFNASSTR